MRFMLMLASQILPKAKHPGIPQLISCFLDGIGCKSLTELVEIMMRLTNSVTESNGWKHNIKTISSLPVSAL